MEQKTNDVQQPRTDGPSGPLNIVLTCNFSPWSAYSGGGQRSTHNLATVLAKRGHQVTVIFTKTPQEHITPPADLAYRLRWADLWDVRSRRNAPLRTLTAVTVAKAALDEVAAGAQVVHANGEEAALLPWLRKRNAQSLPPFALVVTPRYPALPASLSESHSVLQQARLWFTESKYMALGHALRGADAVSPPSHYAADLMQPIYKLTAQQMRPVHNGVPAEFLNYAWQPELTPAGRDERPLLFFGRFDHDKGLDTLVDALGLLGADCPAALLAGRGPDRASLENRIQANNLQDRVQVLDWLSHEALGEALQKSALAVIPSREENFSLAVLSVMAVGTPLITTTVGGTAEVMEDARTGLLIPPGDPAILAKAIQRIQADPSWAASLGQAARQKVREGFTWPVTAAKFEALYREISHR